MQALALHALGRLSWQLSDLGGKAIAVQRNHDAFGGKQACFVATTNTVFTEKTIRKQKDVMTVPCKATTL